jgi:hypothetical protein
MKGATRSTEPPRKDRRLSYQRGSSSAWWVESDYEISDGVLRPKRTGLEAPEYYMPLTQLDEIIHALIRVAHADEDNVERMIIRFARRFGLLGYLYVVAEGQGRGGDPIEWFRAHAEGVRTVVEMIDAMNRCREEELAKLLRPRGFGFGAAIERLPVSLPREYLIKGAPKAVPELHRLIGRAREAVRELINRNIASVRRVVVCNREGNGDSEFEFPSLVAFVYWGLVDVWSDGVTRRCKGCGSIFVRRHGAQRFCPPFGQGEESPCAVRRRVRRYRKRSATYGSRQRGASPGQRHRACGEA